MTTTLPAAESTTSTAPIREVDTALEPDPGETVEFATTDGVTLRGTLFGGSDTGLVVAPAFRAEADTVMTTASPITAAGGFTTLVFDLRGHGASEGDRLAKESAEDLRAALQFMFDRGLPEVFVIGFGSSGTAALQIAAEGEQIAGIVAAFSPPQYQGLDANAVLDRVETPTLFVAVAVGPSERWSKLMHQDLLGPKDLEIYSAPPTGTPFFDLFGARMVGRMLDFIEAYARA